MTRTLVNRVLLALLGLALLTGGAWAAVTGFLGDRVPSWWRGPGSEERLVDRDRYRELAGHDWWDAASMGALAVLAVLALWWLLAQPVRGRSRVLRLPRPWLGVRTQALTSAAEQDIERLPSVRSGRVRIGSGRGGRLRVAVTVRLEASAQPALLLGELHAGPLANLRTATGAEQMDSVVRLRRGRQRAVRVR
ncbi:alkaline shock response membrane anchor protein AmaP [Streptomyces sp. NA04227]|uniref:alkaline shock response membrane anchor protein AmaP n=1 Tax=Streptomyces sp. NA04227 TaxID=2742136 RepID=UPI0015910744|nr:alkaline shock response membrane anchor protein AmaP [Streptomyces sp. NA04227]QKW10500.1 alkaline shock response membrane anchor protein AmaP [Streptomyces sp. NA04227]